MNTAPYSDFQRFLVARENRDLLSQDNWRRTVSAMIRAEKIEKAASTAPRANFAKGVAR